MPRQRSPDRDKAKEIYIQRKGNIPLNEIANQLNLSEGTIRGWKAKDAWDEDLNGAFQSNTKKNTERSKQDTERSNKNKKNSSINNYAKKASDKKSVESEEKTNSPSPFARFGNKNAVGNKGGLGGPIRNKKALKTGEFEAVFFTADIIDEKERALLDVDYDKYLMQYLLIDTLTIREKRIMQRIKETETTPGGMVIESVTKNKGTFSIENTNRNKDGEEWPSGDTTQKQDNSSHIAKPVLKRVMELEDALTRVQARKQAAIAQLHRMEMDDDRLAMDYAKLEIYKQRISGKIDLDKLIDDEDINIDL